MSIRFPSLCSIEIDHPFVPTLPKPSMILRSMPGLGRTILAVLLAEVWQPLRRRDYHALRSLSGVAPVTRRSGKTCVVVRRYACNKRLANALYHWARLATQHDALSRSRGSGRREAKRVRGCAGRLCSPLAPLPCDPNSGCGQDQRAAKHRASRHRSGARHSGQCSANAPSRSAPRDGGVSANNSVFPWCSPAITSFRTNCPRENGAQGGGSRYLSML